jgi:hypothetical protein
LVAVRKHDLETRWANERASSEHSPEIGQPEILAYVREKLLPKVLGERWWDVQVNVLVRKRSLPVANIC